MHRLPTGPKLARSAALLLSLLIAGCQGTPPRSAQSRPDPTPPAVPAAPAPAAAQPQSAQTPVPPAVAADRPKPLVESTAAVIHTAPDPWLSLRERLTAERCDHPRQQHFIKRYAGNPDRFQARLSSYAPVLHYVAEQAAARQLPAAVALVPIVESTYQGYPGRGQRPAGMWQLIPSTARSVGLTVRSGNDQRLDTARATAAALTLFERLLQRFDGHLELALAAYNAGDGRVARALAKHPQRRPRDLPLSRITIDYLDKIDALSCLLSDPSRYGFSLPPLPEGAQLIEVELDFPVDAEQLARELGTDATLLRRYNGAIRGPQTRPAGHRWLLPKGLTAAVASLDAGAVAPTSTTIESSASAVGVHVVQSGDNLWTLARRYGVTVNELRQWNGLSRQSLLRIGQRLRLTP